MASLRMLGGAAAAVVALGMSGSAPAAAQDVCVTATVTVTVLQTVSQTTPQTCAATPLPTRPLHLEQGIDPWLAVEVSVTYP